MTKKIIFLVIALAGLMAFSLNLQQALSAEPDPSGPVPIPYPNTAKVDNAKAIPDWIDNNFKWYGEGKIAQADLLNSLNFMLDNGIMHLSDKAAQEVKSLREENKQLHEYIVQYNESDLDFLKRSADTSSSTESDQALHHLRKAYDLNPNLQTKVVQYDKDHDKWIDVLSIDWGGTHTEGDPDRPIVIGRIYSQDDSSDMVLKGSKINENYVDATRQTPKTDFGSVVKDGISKGGTSLEERIFALLQKLLAEKEGEVENKLAKDASSSTPNLSASKLPSMAIKPEVSRLVQQDNCAMIVALSSEISVLAEEIEFASKLLDDLKAKILVSSSDESKDALQKQISSLEAKIQILIDRLDRTQQKVAELTNRINQNPDVSCNGYSDMASLKLQTQMDRMSKMMSTLSNILKNQHDTAKAIIGNMKG